MNNLIFLNLKIMIESNHIEKNKKINDLPSIQTDLSKFNLIKNFNEYNELFFENSLMKINLSWSTKMTSCAGLFITDDNKIPAIRLSEPLLKYRSLKEIRETLLHEMIHAFCYVKKYDMSDDLSGHGKYFKMKMKEINKLTGFQITIYHHFHKEVELYTKYVWRCNGKCRDEPPYYGYVKRQMNRPPQKSDKWWDEHLKNCGGIFIKIAPSEEEERKELEEKNKRNKERKNNKKIEEIQKNYKTLDSFFIKKENKDIKKRK